MLISLILQFSGYVCVLYINSQGPHSPQKHPPGWGPNMDKPGYLPAEKSRLDLPADLPAVCEHLPVAHMFRLGVPAGSTGRYPGWDTLPAGPPGWH